MIWIAFVIVKLAESFGLIEALGGPKAAELASSGWHAGVWLATALLLFGIEAIIRKIDPTFGTGSRHALPSGTEHQPSPQSTNWDRHFMWPARPIASRNLVFWVTIPPLVFIAFRIAHEQLARYVIALVTWIAVLVVTSLIELKTRQALFAYSRGNANPQAAAPIRLFLAMLFGIASWINVKWFANKKDLGQRTVATQLLDDKLLAFAPRVTLFFIGALVTFLSLYDVTDITTTTNLVLFAVLAVGFFQSSPQLTLLALLGLFTAQQVSLHSSACAAYEKDYKLAISLVLIILAWTLHSWEQAVRYRRAQRAEQLKHKQTQTIVAPWGTAS